MNMCEVRAYNKRTDISDVIKEISATIIICEDFPQCTVGSKIINAIETGNQLNISIIKE